MAREKVTPEPGPKGAKPAAALPEHLIAKKRIDVYPKEAWDFKDPAGHVENVNAFTKPRDSVPRHVTLTASSARMTYLPGGKVQS